MEINQTSRGKNSNIMSIGFSIVAFIMGIVVGAFVFRSGPVQNTEGVKTNDTYQAGWDAAQKRLSESEKFGPIANSSVEIRSITGVVQSIDGNKISIKINPLEPLADPSLDTRTVIATSAAITHMVQRNPEEYKTELAAFMAIMRKPPVPGKERPQPPVSSTKEVAKINDIKVGNTIVVTAGENIKDLKEFSAVSVDIQ